MDVAPFYLSHTNLIDALCFLSAKKKVKIRCFMDPASTVPAERHVLNRLSQHGIEIYVVQVPNGKMHLKCAIVDDDIVIGGAANWTVRGFDNNVEDTLIIQSTSLAQAYRDRLDRLVPLAEYQHPTGNGEEGLIRAMPSPTVRPSSASAAYAAPRLKRFRSIRSARVFFSLDSEPDTGQAAAERIRDHIQSARKQIDVALYLLVAPALVDALAQKAAAGEVPVRLLVDSGMLDASSRSVLEILAAAGVRIRWLGSEKSACISRPLFWTRPKSGPAWPTGVNRLSLTTLKTLYSSNPPIWPSGWPPSPSARIASRSPFPPPAPPGASTNRCASTPTTPTPPGFSAVLAFPGL